jgi:hypothetical protein
MDLAASGTTSRNARQRADHVDVPGLERSCAHVYTGPIPTLPTLDSGDAPFMHSSGHKTFQPSTWTRPLQLLTTIMSVIFTIGTTLQNFVIVNREMLEETMQLAGQTPDEAASNAPGFLLGFRIVGCLYMVGNAIGILSFKGWSWVFWVALVVNVTQAFGFVAIPSEVWEASLDRYGIPGILPSAITDGGALILAVLLIVSLIRYRRPWAFERTTPPQEAIHV